MYFFDLEDYYSSRIIGNLNSRFHYDWEDCAGTYRETRNAYIKAFGQWYSASTIGLKGECKSRVEELYNLFIDYDNPDGTKFGSVLSASTYNTNKFFTMMNGINNYPSYTAETDTVYINYYYTWSGKCFDEQVYYDYVNAYRDERCLCNEILYLVDGDDVGRCEKYSSVSDSGKTECSSCKVVNLDTFLTTDLPNINNVDEFRKAINSELIDVKNRQTLSSYPTLRLLYERYLGNCTDCDKTLNKFTYESMDTFIDLIGKNWVDLVEQFVPATTIWGATDVYRNTVFHQQKHKYRRSTLEFKVQDLEDLAEKDLIACRSYGGDIQLDYGPMRTIEYHYESVIYDITKQSMPETLDVSATTIDFQATAQSDETPRSNPDTPITLNFQVGTTTQTYGNLSDTQVNAIQTQVNTSTQQANSGDVFQIKKSTNYGLSSGPAHCSHIFYGKATITEFDFNRNRS
jgi:hypothetical protein